MLSQEVSAQIAAARHRLIACGLRPREMSDTAMPLSRLLRVRTGSRPILLMVLALTVSGCGGGGTGTGSGGGPSGFDSIKTSQAIAGYTSFVYPQAGQLSVDGTRAFEWTSVSGANSYQLQVGTTPEANDIFDSGIVSGTSVTVPQLPASGTVYARVRANPQGWSTVLQPGHFPRGTYATFRMDADVPGAAFTYPSAGGTADADTPIAWQNEPLALGYRLVLTNAATQAQLLDTGTIRSNQRVVAGLPAGASVNATLTTYYAQNLQRSQQLTFTVGTNTVSDNAMLALARSLAASVRLMADLDNQPHDATPLAVATAAMDDGASDCVAFATALLQVLADVNLPLQRRVRDVCFNYPDCHELVEVYDPDLHKWETVDPTFGLYTTLQSTGAGASVDEISAAVRSQAIGSLSFSFLTANGAAYATAYYVDYPLLFLDVYNLGGTSSYEQAPPAVLTPWLDLIGSSVDGPVSNFYLLQCSAGSSSASADWDGTQRTNSCTNGYTQIFWAINVTLTDGAAIWKPHTFVF